MLPNRVYKQFQTVPCSYLSVIPDLLLLAVFSCLCWLIKLCLRHCRRSIWVLRYNPFFPDLQGPVDWYFHVNLGVWANVLHHFRLVPCNFTFLWIPKVISFMVFYTFGGALGWHPTMNHYKPYRVQITSFSGDVQVLMKTKQRKDLSDAGKLERSHF